MMFRYCISYGSLAPEQSQFESDKILDVEGKKETVQKT